MVDERYFVVCQSGGSSVTSSFMKQSHRIIALWGQGAGVAPAAGVLAPNLGIAAFSVPVIFVSGESGIAQFPGMFPHLVQPLYEATFLAESEGMRLPHAQPLIRACRCRRLRSGGHRREARGEGQPPSALQALFGILFLHVPMKYIQISLGIHI